VTGSGRAAIRDELEQEGWDDYLILDIDLTIVDYRRFIHLMLPRLITAFEAYRVAVHIDETVMLEDQWDAARQVLVGRGIDGRDSIYRIRPVSYFDDSLCRLSFKLGAAEVVRRAAPLCKRAEILSGGAFLIVTAALLDGKALDRLSVRIASRLTPWRGFLHRVLRLGWP
jgi:hypothetical protein